MLVSGFERNKVLLNANYPKLRMVFFAGLILISIFLYRNFLLKSNSVKNSGSSHDSSKVYPIDPRQAAGLDAMQIAVIEQVDQTKIKEIHRQLKYVHGNPEAEIPEQTLINDYIKPTDSILELGTNIGLSTMIAAYKVQDSSKIVTIESDPNFRIQAEENRDANNFKYPVLPAISSKRLVQKGLESMTIGNNEKVPEGWVEVSTITFADLIKQTGVDKFDALIVDCEGCGNDVLSENPQLLQNASLLIYEHDELTEQMYKDILKLFADNNFTRTRCIKAPYGYGNFFYEKECYHAVYEKKH